MKHGCCVALLAAQALTAAMPAQAGLDSDVFTGTLGTQSIVLELDRAGQPVSFLSLSGGRNGLERATGRALYMLLKHQIVGSIIVMLNKGAKGRMAEGVEEEGDLYRAINGAGNDSHITSLLYGAGAPLTNCAGVPWTAAYVDTIGEPTADMRSNIAAEARAKIVYERLMNVTDDPGVKEALGFLMTREIAHQLSFEKALHAIQPNFPQGKLPGMPEFTNVYFNLSQGPESMRGPWNQGDDWEFVEAPEPAVDGGDGTASVALGSEEEALLLNMKSRTASDPDSDPVTGADLGAGVQGLPNA